MAEPRSRTFSWSDPARRWPGSRRCRPRGPGANARRRAAVPPDGAPDGHASRGGRAGARRVGGGSRRGALQPDRDRPRGFATTLLDSAMGTAFVSEADAGTRWTTLELKANFTRAITAETGPSGAPARSCTGEGRWSRPRHASRTRTGSSRTAAARSSSSLPEPLRTLPRLMESLYDPSAVERRWQETWESDGLYAAGAGAAATSRS